jgi:hypothetical protein
VTIYHYTHIEHWANNQARGCLMPTHRLGEGGGFPGIKDKKALFALLEPKPNSWLQNPDVSHAWRDLKAHVGKMLVEIKVDPSDEAAVVDQIHIFGLGIANLLGMIPEEWAVEREKDYWDTRVPLSDYSQELHNFSLPEVVILNPIPMERVVISEQQPLIEGIIRDTSSGRKDYLEMSSAQKLLRQLRMGIPELQRWAPECETALDIQRSRRERF